MSNQEVKRGSVRPGGRTEEVRLAVAEAVMARLKNGNTDFSISDIARDAGIHRSTIYRRWKTREELIFEATTLHVAKLKIPDSGNWPQDLHDLVEALADFASDPVEIAIVKAMMDPGNPNLSQQLTDYWMPLMQWHTLPIQNAITRGEISPELDPQMIYMMILSPLLLGALVTGAAAPDTEKARLVEMVTRMTRL